MTPSPTLSAKRRWQLLEPPTGPVHMVLDTDTYNEIDDQFALAYALLSPERITVDAIYAAPYHNDRSEGPADGMEKSYDEILRLLERLHRPSDGFVFKGSTSWMTSPTTPIASAVVDDLIVRARQQSDGPLYVGAIGAITNIASAILTAPDILEKIVVVWLGGQPANWHHTREFNLSQDLHASRVLFDSGVALVRVPCINVAEHIKTTQVELDRFMRGRSPLGDYLYDTYSGYFDDHYAISKEIWDLGPVAWLVNPGWTDSVLLPSPILTMENTWSHDPHRHLGRELIGVRRDPIFADLFRKMEHFAAISQ